MTCSVPDCERPVRARGLCAADYERWNRRRDLGWAEPIDPRAPVPQGRSRKTLAEKRETERLARQRYGQPVNKKQRDRNRSLVLELKSVPCMDCKQSFPPICMDFDHRGDEEKLFNISQATTASVEILLAEIAKCDVVCSNCHRVRGALRMDGIW